MYVTPPGVVLCVLSGIGLGLRVPGGIRDGSPAQRLEHEPARSFADQDAIGGHGRATGTQSMRAMGQTFKPLLCNDVRDRVHLMGAPRRLPRASCRLFL